MAVTILSGDARKAARGETTTTYVGNVAAATTAAGLPNTNTFDIPVAWPLQTPVTAKAGGTHAAATPLTAQVHNVSTVATAADSVVLPAMAPGQIAVVINSGASSLQLYANGTGTINGVATDTGVPIAAGKTGIYFAVTTTQVYGGTLA